MVDLNDDEIPALSIKKAIFNHHYQELQEQVAKSKTMLSHKDVQECPSGLMETQSHCVTCPKWQDIRMGLDMNKIEDLVTFFQRFLTEKVKGRTGSLGAAQQVSCVTKG